jgi:periplasmic protein TonB
MAIGQASNIDRIKAALPAVLIHALIGYALITGLKPGFSESVSENLKMFDVTPETLPPPPERPPLPPTEKSKRPEGAASPPNLKSKATQIVAPQPEIRLPVPPPVVSAPAPSTGAEASSGAAEIAGPGTGSGGVGTGTGSGGSGFGPGGGGYGNGNGRGMTPPRQIRGRLYTSDIPVEVQESGTGGTVHVRYVVEADGRASNCTVTQSSGNALLDRTTCRLIEQRFRFVPTKDPAGRSIRSNIVENHTWHIENIFEEQAQQRRPRRW